MVLVTLGGCHLLDGLCGAPEKSFVRGIVLAPWELQRATLVEHVIKLPLLLG